MQTQIIKLFEKKQCPICLKKANHEQFHRFSKCRHTFCSSCITQHISIRIREKKIVTCLEESCKEVLLGDSKHIKVLSKKSRESYFQVILEYTNSQTVKCRVKKCPGFIIMNSPKVENGKKVLTCSHCPNAFCAKCKNKVDLCSCEQNSIVFQSLKDHYNYKRCPKCGHVIEKVKGCNHLTCVCKYQFCELCSLKWSNGHLCPIKQLSTNELMDNTAYQDSSIIRICRCLKFLVVNTLITVLVVLEYLISFGIVLCLIQVWLCWGIFKGFQQWKWRYSLRYWQIILLILLAPISFPVAFVNCMCRTSQFWERIYQCFPFLAVNLYRSYQSC